MLGTDFSHLELKVFRSSLSIWNCADKMMNLENAALFHFKIFEKVKTIVVIIQLSPENAVAIGKCQNSLENPCLASDLASIAGDMAFLTAILTHLEEFAFGKTISKGQPKQNCWVAIKKKKEKESNSVLERNPDVLVLSLIMGSSKGEEGVIETLYD